MPAKQKTLDDLFLETLKDMYHAEKQLMRALPKMAKAADSDELRQAFETHRDETEGLRDLPLRHAQDLGRAARDEGCRAAVRGDPCRGEEDRRASHQARRKFSEPESRLETRGR